MKTYKPNTSIIWLLWCIILMLHISVIAVYGQTLTVSYLSATVDGDLSEWNSNSFSSELYKSSDPGKDAFADLYLRYDAKTDLLYALVTPKSGYVLYYNNDNDAAITINGITVDPSDENSGDPAADFAWVNLGFDGDNKHAQGFEISMALAEGTHPFTADVRVQVENQNKKQNCGLNDVDLILSPLYDYSDAPSNYQAAAHVVNANDLYLGTTVDAESGVIDDGNGSGDDSEGVIDDENGIIFLKDGQPMDLVSLAKGDTFQISVNYLNFSGKTVKLVGWIDYNGDGQFSNNEKVINRVFNSQNSSQNWTSNDIIVPTDGNVLENQTTFSRFRLEDTNGDIQPSGTGGTGEVEDYKVFMDEPSDPVSITLSSFTVYPKDEYVLLQWTVENEINHAGYNLYRSSTNYGPWIRINPELIGADAFPEPQMPVTYSYRDSIISQQPVFYILEDVDLNGRTTRHPPVHLYSTGINESDITEFKLHPAFPNPFNPSTTLAFQVEKTRHIVVYIYDILGRKVLTLTDRVYTPGRYELTWNGKDEYGNQLSSGLYIARMHAGTFHRIIRLNLIR